MDGDARMLARFPYAGAGPSGRVLAPDARHTVSFVSSGYVGYGSKIMVQTHPMYWTGQIIACSMIRSTAELALFFLAMGSIVRLQRSLMISVFANHTWKLEKLNSAHALH